MNLCPKIFLFEHFYRPGNRTPDVLTETLSLYQLSYQGFLVLLCKNRTLTSLIYRLFSFRYGKTFQFALHSIYKVWGILKLYLSCSKCQINNYQKIGRYQFIDKITKSSGGTNKGVPNGCSAKKIIHHVRYV